MDPNFAVGVAIRALTAVATLLRIVDRNLAAPGQDVDELEYYLSLLSSSSTEKRSKHVISRLLGTYMVLKNIPGAPLLEPVLHYSEYASDKAGKRSSMETVTKAEIEAQRAQTLYYLSLLPRVYLHV